MTCTTAAGLLEQTCGEFLELIDPRLPRLLLVMGVQEEEAEEAAAFEARQPTKRDVSIRLDACCPALPALLTVDDCRC